MQQFTYRVFLMFIAQGLFITTFSQTRTNTELLKRASVIHAGKEKIKQEQLEILAKQKGWDMTRKDKKGNITLLIDIDASGMPIYISTENNIIAAATIGTNHLWPGGSTGLNLNGSSPSVKNKLAIWDGGKVRTTHQELTGRVVQRDVLGSISDHATHVAGTLIASGVVPQAKGMSFGQLELVAYDFSGDESEIMNEAPNLLVSNHSYSINAGWRYNETAKRWEFMGQAGANEDYKFGYYSIQSQMRDSIAYNAPNYLMVYAAGNNRTENGPAVGSNYWRLDSNNVMVDAGNRPLGISSNDSFDVISAYGVSKNLLTVGAVYPIAYGYNRPSDVVMSEFSSWGPTDDGRIKPDVVADGVDLLSSIATADNTYANYSGTSMAAPNTSGSLLLLQEYYNKLHPGVFMRSATLKGLVIHTADEAGLSPGPDYQNGWGLINMKKAAAVITANNTGHIIQENTLANNATYSFPVIASGNGTLSATICWTDPKGDIAPISTALNNRTPKLVNDLDIVIKKGSTVFSPWILNPSTPTAAATKGINILDNVEKVELTNVIPGDTYTIEVTHKGTLARGQQAYSLIISGVGGLAYCTSNATNSSGARIDSVSFANIKNKNAAGCTTYSNFTNLTGNIEISQTLPLFIRLNSCDASAADKIVKVFLDINNDGDFEDAGENITTSAVINGNGDFATNITIPANVTQGNYSILRIVMQETNSAASVSSCGTYTRGETQDYKVYISAPSKDAGVLEIVSPIAGECKTSEQYATVRLRNYGIGDITNVPVSILIKQGTNTIATLNGIFTDTLSVGADIDYTFQTPFALAANTSYTFTASTSVAGDPISDNNTTTTTITTRSDPSAPTGTANICGTTATLAATSTSSAPFNWYSSLTAPSALAFGSTATTTTIQPNYYLSTGEVNGKLGPANKLVFPQGSYNVFNDNQLRVIFTAVGPLRIENARLYIGQGGKINFTLRKVTNVNYLTGNYSFYPAYDQTYTVDAYATAPVKPIPGNPNNDPADLGAIYYLGIDIPQAGDYAITIQSTDASIFRNNNITTINYPYTLPGIISFTGNSATDNSNPDFYKGFYYFFYNTTIKLGSCASARTPIIATTSTAPAISITGNVLSSNSATGNQWYFNGTPIGGATNQTYTATQTGVYKVEATDAKSCKLFSNEITFTLTAVTNVDPSEIGLIVSPNPTTSGEFHLQLETRKKSNLHISLVNTVGQKVYNFSIPDFVGRLSQPVKPGKLASGIYYLQVQHDKKMYVKKILFAQ